jgi:hypothetical protein
MSRLHLRHSTAPLAEAESRTGHYRFARPYGDLPPDATRTSDYANGSACKLHGLGVFYAGEGLRFIFASTFSRAETAASGPPRRLLRSDEPTKHPYSTSGTPSDPASPISAAISTTNRHINAERQPPEQRHRRTTNHGLRIYRTRRRRSHGRHRLGKPTSPSRNSLSQTNLTNILPFQNEWDKYFPVETNTGDLNIPDFNFSEFTGGSYDTNTNNANPAPNANYTYPQPQQSQPNSNIDNSATQPTDLSDVSFGAMSFFPTPSFYADPHPDRLPARNPR